MHRCHHHHFTLIEIVLVLAILAALLTVVLPNVGRIPAKYSRAKAIESIQRVFSDASLRARTTGQVIQLTVNPRNSTATTRELNYARQTNMSNRKQASGGNTEESALWSSKTEFSDKIKWLKYGNKQNFREMNYRFYPNGEASGPNASFEWEKQEYRLYFDNLTGTVSVVAMND